MIGQLLGEQGQAQAAARLASDSGLATWQDPQVYLMAASGGKSSLQYHDIADFISTLCMSAFRLSSKAALSQN